MAFGIDDALGAISGLAGLFGGNSAAKAAKASAYTQRDAYFSQLADALGWNDTQRQVLMNVLGPQLGLNITTQAQTPDASGKIGGYIPGKFGQPTLNVTQNPNWNPLDNPVFRNLMAQLHAQQQASQRGVAGVNRAGQLAGHYGTGSTANYYNQRNMEQNNAAGYNFANQQYGRQQDLLSTIMNLAQSKAGQQQTATQGLGEAGQQLGQALQAQNASAAKSWAQIGKALAAAFDHSNNVGAPTSRTGYDSLPGVKTTDQILNPLQAWIPPAPVPTDPLNPTGFPYGG